MNKTTFFLILALVGTIVACFVSIREWRHAAREHKYLQESYQTLLNTPAAGPITIRDTIRDTIAGTSTFMYVPLKVSGPVDGYVSKGLADTLAASLKVASKEIDRLKSKVITLETKAKGQRITDTVTKTQWLVMQDPSFDVRVNLTNDSIYPKVRLRLAQAYAPVKKNIFSRTEYRSIIMASDPRINISEVYDVNKVPKSPRWGISLFGGPMVVPSGLTYGVGAGLSYDIIQF